MTRLRMALWIFALALLAWTLDASVALAQDGSIVYNKVDARGFLQLWQINPDGSGDQHIPQDMGYPVWSWDGQLLGLSSSARANVFSWNVFVYDPKSGDRQQVTNFEDQVEGDRSNWVLALFKAFSPQRDRVAVSCWFHAQTSSRGSSTTPILRVYSLDGTLQAQVGIGDLGGVSMYRGAGVDWSPNEDLILYPFDATAITERGLRVPVTAIYATPPEDDALRTGQARQLTFPRASQSFTTLAWDQDFQPAFSPDGQQVAYIRSRSSIVNGVVKFSTPSIRIVNIDGTNDHEIIRFRQGQFVSRVSWSPDGSMLVFDRGRQWSSGGFPLPTPDPRTMALFTINADGTDEQQLQAPPALFPSWNPVGAAIAP